jgi:regulation of enolase protein 1 (concanavalin A-like superfamily)
MHPRVHAIVFLPVLLLVVGLSTPVHGQENGVKHPLTFAELTYGDAIQAIVADGAGGFWFGGRTCSTTLPTTSNAIQKSWSGQLCDAGLLGRMKSDGTVTYLSYFGGSGRSAVAALARGANGNLYVAGATYSADFPTTAGAYDRTCGTDGACNYGDPSVPELTPDGRHGDGFVAELTPDGSQIVLSTYLGGSGGDAIAAIALDAAGRIDVAGSTASANFPITSGALQRTYSGGADTEGEPLTDAFFVRLTADGSSLQYGTFLGGSGGDSAYGVAAAPDGATYVAGTTSSGDFSTLNPAKPHSASTRSSAFLAKFSVSGPVYSTYVGDAGGDAVAVAVVDNDIYIGGSGEDPSGAPNIGSEAYIAELDAATGEGRRRIAFHGVGGTFQRVSGTWAYGSALAVDQNHVAYFAGRFAGNCTLCGPEIGRYPTTWDASRRASSRGDADDATLSIVDFRPERPSVLYSTMLGGSGTDLAAAVAPDGAGGAFFGGQSEGFESVNGQPPPQKDAGSNYQSFLAHVGAQQATMPTAPADIVLYPYDSSGTGFNPTAIAGEWTIDQDPAAAGGWIVREPDQGAAKVPTPGADPHNYFELEFLAEAHVPYHLWMRMRADNDSYQNDSVWVQFSDSVDAGGNPVWRIGSTGATAVVLEDCSGCGEQGWGWNDNGYGAAGTPVMFATSGWHTIRIQQREDGIAFDQIVLSSSQWANKAPGANKNDSTILRPSYAVPYPSGDMPPTVSISSPSNGSTFHAGSNITITASAADSDGAIASVDLYASGTLLARSTAAPYSTSWQNVQPGTYSVYAVATDNQGAITISSAISVLVTGGTSQSLPTGWIDADVGKTGAAGSATYSNGTFTVRGAGADVWGTSDAFNYVYMPMAASGWIVARVSTVSDEANWVKAGVMIRGSLDPSSAQAFMLVSHAKGVAFQRRTADGNASVSTSGSASIAPRWVKLVRIGATISGYESADGSNWTLVGTDAVAISGPTYIGLAVSSHVNGTAATATFDSVTTSVPAGWADSDVGSVPFPGSASYKNGTFTVTGSGADIWGSADAFHYATTSLNGDGTIVARVATVQNVDAWTKAGVMIRETQTAGSAHAFMLVSPGKGVAFQRRGVTNGTSASTAGSASAAPHWVRLTRSGNTFTAYESSDGTSWTQVGTETIPMAQMVYVGLAVTSHSTSASATCTFDHVSVQ